MRRLKLKEETLNKVNEQMENLKHSRMELNVRDSLVGAAVYAGNWQVCDVLDLTDMILELQAIKAELEAATGCEF